MADDEGFFNAKADCLHTLMGREALNRGSNKKKLKSKAWYKVKPPATNFMLVGVKPQECTWMNFGLDFI